MLSLQGVWNDPFVATGLTAFPHDLADHGATDSVRLGHFGKTSAAVTVAEDGGAIDVQRSPADVAPFQPRAPHAGADPFDDQVAFQLGDGSDDDHHGAAERAAGVYVLPEADEVEVEVVELIEHFEEVFDRAGQPIEAQTRSTSNLPRRASAIS